MMNLSRVARRAGRRTRMIMVAQSVPREIEEQMVAAIAEAKFPTMAVTMMRIEAEVRMAPMDLL